MDHLSNISAFVNVVEKGGFAAAARHLDLSPSVVTSHIQALEQRLGVRLLNRSTRKVSLTETGQSYYERCVRILSDIDDADRIAEAGQSVPRGLLKLNVSVALPPRIAPVIARYSARFPDTSVRLTMSGRMVDLVEEGYDLAVRIKSVPESSLIVRRIASFRMIVCGSPDYFAKHGVPHKPADLAAHNCLTFSDADCNDSWRFSGPGGEQFVQLKGNLSTNSANALLFAAAQGQGLIIAPDFLARDHIESGQLVPVLTDFVQDELPISVVYPHRQHLPAKVRTFIDMLAEHFDASAKDDAPRRDHAPKTRTLRVDGMMAVPPAKRPQRANRANLA
jgi:DNA-binding transcriptional LysR family regulator